MSRDLQGENRLDGKSPSSCEHGCCETNFQFSVDVTSKHRRGTRASNDSFQKLWDIIFMLLCKSSNLLSSKGNHTNTSFLFGLSELCKEVFEDRDVFLFDPMHSLRLLRELGQNMRGADR